MIEKAVEIINSIREDSTLESKALIESNFESLQYKYPSISEANVVDVVKDMLAFMENVRTFKEDKELDKHITGIKEFLETAQVESPHVIVSKMYNEYDLAGDVKKIRESDAYSDPTVKSFIDSVDYQLTFTNMPTFAHLTNFANSMRGLAHNKSIKESVDAIDKYISDNYERLLVMETVYRLDSMPGQVYKEISEKLKTLIVEDKCTANIIRLTLGEGISQVGFVSGLVQSLDEVERTKNPEHFDLGSGNGLVSVHNFIGPAIKEESSIIFPLAHKFVKIHECEDGKSAKKDGEEEEETNEKRTIGSTDNAIVEELSINYMYENHPAFMSLMDDFATLGFSPMKNGLRSSNKGNTVELKLNENRQLDLIVNGAKVNNPDDININELLILEGKNEKTAMTNLMANLENIYHVEFIKHLLNESTGGFATIINIEKDYYVFENVNQAETSIFKMNGSQLHNYMLEKFDYDVRGTFDVELGETYERFKNLRTRRVEINTELEKLSETLEKIQTQLKQPELQKVFVDKLTDLEKTLEEKEVQLKNEAVNVEHAITKLTEAEDRSEGYSAGDRVVIKEQDIEGTVTAVDSATGRYMVMDDDNGVHQVEFGALGQIEAGEAPEDAPERSEMDADNASAQNPPSSDISTQNPSDIAAQGGKGAESSRVREGKEEGQESESNVNEHHKETPKDQLSYIKKIAEKIDKGDVDTKARFVDLYGDDVKKIKEIKAKEADGEAKYIKHVYGKVENFAQRLGINEDRQEDNPNVQYQDVEDPKTGDITKVIAHLSGSDAGKITKLAKKFESFQDQRDQLDELIEDIRSDIRGEINEEFFNEYDQMITKVLSTGERAIRISKLQEGSVSVKWKAAFESLSGALDTILSRLNGEAKELLKEVQASHADIHKQFGVKNKPKEQKVETKEPEPAPEPTSTPQPADVNEGLMDTIKEKVIELWNKTLGKLAAKLKKSNDKTDSDLEKVDKQVDQLEEKIEDAKSTEEDRGGETPEGDTAAGNDLTETPEEAAAEPEPVAAEEKIEESKKK